MNKWCRYACLGLFGVTLLLCSCSSEDDPVIPQDDTNPPEEILEVAETREELMENFQSFYEAMDYNAYRDMLHPDYLMLVQAATQIDFPEVGDSLDLAEELEISRKMFSGESGVDANGQWAAPISSIQIAVLEQKTAWSVSPPSDRIPNVDAALFDVWFNLDRTGHSTLQVQGTLQFYIVSQDTLHNGVSQTYWRLIGMQDFTGFKSISVESSSWGGIKAMFR